jgi:hypothetical protein
MTTRRTVLLGGFGAGLFVAAASGWAWLSVGYSRPSDTIAVALSEKQLAVVAALTEALVPGEDGMPNGLALGVPQRVDEEVWSASPAIQSDLKAALLLLEHAPPLVGFASRFTHLDIQGRRECLRAMLGSDKEVLVVAATALKQMIHLFTYASDEAWPAIGYDGPRVGRAAPESARAYAALLKRG